MPPEGAGASKGDDDDDDDDDDDSATNNVGVVDATRTSLGSALPPTPPPPPLPLLQRRPSHSLRGKGGPSIARLVDQLHNVDSVGAGHHVGHGTGGTGSVGPGTIGGHDSKQVVEGGLTPTRTPTRTPTWASAASAASMPSPGSAGPLDLPENITSIIDRIFRGGSTTEHMASASTLSDLTQPQRHALRQLCDYRGRSGRKR